MSCDNLKAIAVIDVTQMYVAFHAFVVSQVLLFLVVQSLHF